MSPPIGAGVFHNGRSPHRRADISSERSTHAVATRPTDTNWRPLPMPNADDLLVEIAELILGAGDQIFDQERTLPIHLPHPAGDSLGLTLLGYETARLLPPGRGVRPRIISPDPLDQLRAAEHLTRQAPIADFPFGTVGIITRLCDEIRERTR